VVTFVLDVVKYILGDVKSDGGGTHRSAINTMCCYSRANSGSRFVNFVQAKPANNDN
jgi:hypothetical protein